MCYYFAPSPSFALLNIIYIYRGYSQRQTIIFDTLQLILSQTLGNANTKRNLNVPVLTVTESSDSIKSIKEYADGPDYRHYNSSWKAFEKLRDCAIDNLCRSVKAQVPIFVFEIILKGA